jgi:heterodisulfide reductase subunit A
VIGADHCLPGTDSERLLRAVRADRRVEFVRMRAPGCVGVEASDGRAVVTCVTADGSIEKRECDMVVLAPAMEGPRGAEELSRMLEIAPPDGRTGFFENERARLGPVSTTSEGVFVAGAARGPCDVETAVAQGQAAAGRILSSLVPGETLLLEAAVATIDSDLCSSCGMCVAVCPFSAIRRDEEHGRVTVEQTLCRGCGTCAAACPSGAIRAKHFDDAQVYAEIRGVLR